MLHIRARRSCLPTVVSAIALFLTLSQFGCGKSAAPKVVTVRGKVICAQVKTLEGATVRFWPQDAKITLTPSAKCQPDGTFTMDCPAGNYKVTVAARPAVNAGVPPPQGQGAAIPMRYQDSIQTPLQVTVVEGDAEEKVLKLD
jgi:hypothetical protein